MSRKRGVRATVLAEDQRLASFARRVLENLGFHRREIFVEPIPKSGAGESWVRKNYPKQVSLCRQKSSHQRVALVVGCDADTGTVAARIKQLDDELDSNDVERRKGNDAVAILVTRRNIETWFKYFRGDTVDEETDYKKEVKKPDYKGAAEGFVKEFDQFRNDPKNLKTLPSLRSSYEEIARLLDK